MCHDEKAPRRMRRLPLVVACVVLVALLLLAVLLIAGREWYQQQFYPGKYYAGQLAAQPGYGSSLAFEGPQTRFLPNPVLDKVISLRPESTGPLIQHLESGRLDIGQVIVFDLALWCQVTGLRKQHIPVLGQDRVISDDEYVMVAKAWALWDKEGRPTADSSGITVPVLHDYPDYDEMLRLLGSLRSDRSQARSHKGSVA